MVRTAPAPTSRRFAVRPVPVPVAAFPHAVPVVGRAVERGTKQAEDTRPGAAVM